MTPANSPRVDLDEEEHVQALEEDRVHSQEIRGQQALRLGTDEVPPRQRVPATCRIESRLLQHSAHGGGRDRDADPRQLTMDTQVAPPRVLPSQAQDQGSNLRIDGTTAGTPMGIGPVAGNETSVPAQQCLGPHDEH